MLADNPPQSDTSSIITLELFVAGNNIYSSRAKANLDSLLGRLNLRPITVDVIDVLKAPREALTRRIFATPTLVITAGKRCQILVGDMSDRPFEQVAHDIQVIISKLAENSSHDLYP